MPTPDPHLQFYSQRDHALAVAFERLRREHPYRLERSLQLGWSIWGFGDEDLLISIRRLARHGISWVEMPGTHHGADLGYRVEDARRILDDHGMRASGICGIFDADHDLSAPGGRPRQAALDYIRRELDIGARLGIDYMIIVPGAVGRTMPYDAEEMRRSADSLHRLGDEFAAYGIAAAIEPIRVDEVSFCHTVADALAYIRMADHPGIAAINGDVYHMLHGEGHLGDAVVAAGSRLCNLHLADTNRGALGQGMLDLDTLIRACYLSGCNAPGRHVTCEPLGPGCDPYQALFGRADAAALDDLVASTVGCWREREQLIRRSWKDRGPSGSPCRPAYPPVGLPGAVFRW